MGYNSATMDNGWWLTKSSKTASRKGLSVCIPVECALMKGLLLGLPE